MAKSGRARCTEDDDLRGGRLFPLRGALERAGIRFAVGGSWASTAFVTPEDILLAKLHWFRAGGEVSDVQWRDIRGISRGRRETLDKAYLEESARKLALADLLERALAEM